MDVIIYDVYSTFYIDITNMWILSKMIEDTVVKCKILRDDSPGLEDILGIGYRFVEEEKRSRKL
jgi:hypothetical protein